MSVHVDILTGPLPEAPPRRDLGLGEGFEVGAVVVFEGVVRETEDRRPLVALEYQAYEPMAQESIRKIAGDLIARFGLIAVRVEHSRGAVPVGAISFRLTVVAVHRKEALAAADEFIDVLKRDVPIWKKAVYRDP
ncbi:MAG: molybdenum cofactor biosynthesis protein MoaE [Phycisphaeraceae bacterium]|nr:molybdenum cofactor biosynthesis protein MoaE [Phycisphaeraceae bacterium]